MTEISSSATRLNCDGALDMKKISNKRLMGATCIVAGTAIGAAMLALPVSMGRAGFVPSVVTFLLSWAFMLYPALLLLELCLRFRNETNIISLATKTLGGKVGTWIASLAYICLLYALMTAYIAALSSLAQGAIKGLVPIEIPSGVIAVLLMLFLSFLFSKGVGILDQINRIFSIGLLVTFVAVIASSLSYSVPERLTEVRWSYLLPSLSIGFTSFGFHVVIPTLSTYLEYDAKPLRKAIVLGSVMPLVAYIIWQAACLSSAPLTGSEMSIDGAYERGVSGAKLLGEIYMNPLLVAFADGFAVTAIVTSFIGVSLSIVDFIKDGISKYVGKKSLNVILLLAFIPPVWFSTTSPQVFFKALDVAGIFGVVLLLGLLPACMVWSYRYSASCAKDRMVRSDENGYRAPGGKKTLIIYGVFSLGIILFEILRLCS